MRCWKWVLWLKVPILKLAAHSSFVYRKITESTDNRRPCASYGRIPFSILCRTGECRNSNKGRNIGQSDRRLAQLQTGNWHSLKLKKVYRIFSPDGKSDQYAFLVEQVIILRNKKRISGEWINQTVGEIADTLGVVIHEVAENRNSFFQTKEGALSAVSFNDAPSRFEFTEVAYSEVERWNQEAIGRVEYERKRAEIGREKILKKLGSEANDIAFS